MAYLLLSLMRGGHGWVEGVAQAPWCQLWTLTTAWGVRERSRVLTEHL